MLLAPSTLQEAVGHRLALGVFITQTPQEDRGLGAGELSGDFLHDMTHSGEWACAGFRRWCWRRDGKDERNGRRGVCPIAGQKLWFSSFVETG